MSETRKLDARDTHTDLFPDQQSDIAVVLDTLDTLDPL